MIPNWAELTLIFLYVVGNIIFYLCTKNQISSGIVREVMPKCPLRGHPTRDRSVAYRLLVVPHQRVTETLVEPYKSATFQQVEISKLCRTLMCTLICLSLYYRAYSLKIVQHLATDNLSFCHEKNWGTDFRVYSDDFPISKWKHKQ